MSSQVDAAPQSPGPVPAPQAAPGRAQAPFAVGDQIQLLHTCRVNWPGGPPLHAPAVHRRVLTIEAVVPLNTGSTWRIEATRCDGSALAVIVGPGARDVLSDVQLLRAKPAPS